MIASFRGPFRYRNLGYKYKYTSTSTSTSTSTYDKYKYLYLYFNKSTCTIGSKYKYPVSSTSISTCTCTCTCSTCTRPTSDKNHHNFVIDIFIHQLDQFQVVTLYSTMAMCSVDVATYLSSRTSNTTLFSCFRMHFSLFISLISL
jgi:hypothetical protein